VLTDGRAPLLIERPRQGVLALWLDRPRRRNAFDAQLTDELLAAVGDPGDARAIVIGSTDPRSFSAGADLSIPDTDRAGVSDRLYELHLAIARSPVPVIAAVEGAAVGGGAQVAIAADMRVGGRDARFRFPGPGHGLAVGAWGLPSLVGRSRALDLCLTMRTVGADEAFRIGLLDRLADDARAEALELAAALAALDPAAVRRTKEIVNEATRAPAALEHEREGNRAWSGSVEGLTR
jgi:enoyl-CoA hydratase/carnithine racemase